MSDGPSERELAFVAGRYGLRLRASVVVLTGVFAVVDTWRQACLVAGVCGWCVLQPWLRTRLRARGPLIVADASVVAAVGLSQLLLGPQPVSSWVYAVCSITAVTSHYEWPCLPLAGWFIAGSSIVGYTAGNLVTSADRVSWLWLPLLVQSTLTCVSFALVRAGALGADRIAERAARRRRDAVITAARRASELEYLAMLHDTASTTLLMVSTRTADDGGWIAERARHDLLALAGAGRTESSRVDLSSLLDTLAEHPGVRLELDVRGPLMLHAKPALAIFHGVLEALTNVRRHAGDTAVSLRAGRDERGRTVVDLRDRGRGFHVADVPPHRRGISGSIVGRMRSVGGAASVTSDPGTGTAVRWTWPDA